MLANFDLAMDLSLISRWDFKSCKHKKTCLKICNATYVIRLPCINVTFFFVLEISVQKSRRVNFWRTLPSLQKFKFHCTVYRRVRHTVLRHVSSCLSAPTSKEIFGCDSRRRKKKKQMGGAEGGCQPVMPKRKMPNLLPSNIFFTIFAMPWYWFGIKIIIFFLQDITWHLATLPSIMVCPLPLPNFRLRPILLQFVAQVGRKKAERERERQSLILRFVT